jgi:hypothetical protein
LNEEFPSSDNLVINSGEKSNSINITHMEQTTNDLEVQRKEFLEEENHDNVDDENLTSYFFISTVVFLIQKSLRELYLN